MNRSFCHELAITLATFVFPVTSPPIRGNGRITTVGSSNVLLALGATDQPFSGVRVGDEIVVTKNAPRPETALRRLVTVLTDDHTLTVGGAAIDLSTGPGGGWPFDVRRIDVGAATDDTAGWINVGDVFNKQVKIEVIVLGAGATVSFSIQGRGVGDVSVPVELLNGSFTTAVVSGTPDPLAAGIFPVPEYVSSVRVGLKVAGGAATATVSAYILGNSHLSR